MVGGRRAPTVSGLLRRRCFLSYPVIPGVLLSALGLVTSGWLDAAA